MKILLLEDDNIWQLRIEMMLEKLGYTDTLFANSIAPALNTINEKKPKLIIADIHLLESEVFSLYKKNNIVIPTIFISSNANKKHIEKIKKIPNSLFLEKPFGQFTLDTAINNLITKNDGLEFLNNDVQFNTISAKMVFKTINDTKMLDLLNFNEVDKKVLTEKWFNLKTFAQIGNEIGITSERVRIKYDAAVRKLKTKIQRVANTLYEYNEFKKVRYNAHKLKKVNTIEKEYLAIDILNIHIDEVIEIPTKYRNVLKERDLTRLGDLTNVSFKQLALTKHLGEGSAKMIEDALAKFGLKLKA